MTVEIYYLIIFSGIKEKMRMLIKTKH